MNSNYYKNLEDDFNCALDLVESEYSHEELIIFLETGNIQQRQYAALNLSYLNNKNEADILVSNLTGCDGKIREAVAYKIYEFLTADINYCKYFDQGEIFANASIDINANICRLVIDSAKILSKDPVFATQYLNYIYKFIYEAFKELDNFIFKDKKYVINKQLFKLYWSLEALKIFAIDIEQKSLYPLLERAIQENEYTIREKVAQILVLLKQKKYSKLKEKLMNDENYYVRVALLNA